MKALIIEFSRLFEAEYGSDFANSIKQALCLYSQDQLRSIGRSIAEGNKLDDIAHDVFGSVPTAPAWHRDTFAPRVVRF